MFWQDSAIASVCTSLPKFSASQGLHLPMRGRQKHNQNAPLCSSLWEGAEDMQLRTNPGFVDHWTNRKDAVVTEHIMGILICSHIRFTQLCLMNMISNLSSTFLTSLQMNLPLFSEQFKPHLELIRYIPCWSTDLHRNGIYSSLWLLLIFSFKLFYSIFIWPFPYCWYFNFYWSIWEKERNLWSHLFMHSFVTSCMCPDQRADP